MPSSQAISSGPSDPKSKAAVAAPTATKNRAPAATRRNPRTAAVTVTNRRPVKTAVAATNKKSRPPVSPTSPAAAGRNVVRPLRLKKMSTASDSQSPLSQASQAPSLESQPESENDLMPIEIDDDADNEV